MAEKYRRPAAPVPQGGLPIHAATDPAPAVHAAHDGRMTFGSVDF